MPDELTIGKAGEHIAIADLLLRGVTSYLTDQGNKYDVVADTEKGLIRVQVKTTQKMRRLAQRANPIYFFHIKRTGKTGTKSYKRTDFDCWALVLLDRRQVCYVPNDGTVKSFSVCIRDKGIDYSGHQGGGYKNGLYLQNLTWENFYENYARS